MGICHSKKSSKYSHPDLWLDTESVADVNLWEPLDIGREEVEDEGPRRTKGVPQGPEPIYVRWELRRVEMNR